MFRIPLTGLEYLPIPAECRSLFLSDEDLPFLKEFSWRLILPNVSRWQASQNIESLVVRVIKNGFVFYPHHLVFLAQTVGVGRVVDLSGSPKDLFSQTSSLAKRSKIIHINRYRWDVRRENLRLRGPAEAEFIPDVKVFEEPLPPAQEIEIPIDPPSSSNTLDLDNLFRDP